MSISENQLEQEIERVTSFHACVNSFINSKADPLHGNPRNIAGFPLGLNKIFFRKKSNKAENYNDGCGIFFLVVKALPVYLELFPKFSEGNNTSGLVITEFSTCIVKILFSNIVFLHKIMNISIKKPGFPNTDIIS